MVCLVPLIPLPVRLMCEILIVDWQLLYAVLCGLYPILYTSVYMNRRV